MALQRPKKQHTNINNHVHVSSHVGVAHPTTEVPTSEAIKGSERCDDCKNIDSLMEKGGPRIGMKVVQID